VTPYGYRDKVSRFIFGPGNFEMSSANVPLTPFYIEPQYLGQEPFGCVQPEVGIFLFYPKSVGRNGLVYAYDGVES
jgi:hypothetical protein